MQGAELAMLRRLGAPEERYLPCRAILRTHEKLGRSEEALRMKRDIYSDV